MQSKLKCNHDELNNLDIISSKLLSGRLQEHSTSHAPASVARCIPERRNASRRCACLTHIVNAFLPTTWHRKLCLCLAYLDFLFGRPAHALVVVCLSCLSGSTLSFLPVQPESPDHEPEREAWTKCLLSIISF
jgi:hypothetical protein